MHALEVRELGLVAGLDQRLEGALDERRDAAAEDGLLAEEVGLGLLEEGGLQYAAAGGADAFCIGERRSAARSSVAFWWMATSAGTPPPSVKTRRTRWPGPLGATIVTSTSSGELIWPKWMLKPWANITMFPVFEVVGDVLS